MKAIMIAIFACGMAACMPEEPAPTSPADNPGAPGASDGTPVDPSMRDITDVTSASGSITPLAQDCVFIQWCDQPNSSNGTVCIVRSSAACQSQCSPSVLPAIQTECEADARAVCGGVTPTGRIFCSTNHP